MRSGGASTRLAVKFLGKFLSVEIQASERPIA